MIENRHVSRVFQHVRVIFPPFSLTHNFWCQIWATHRLIVCTRTSLQLGAYQCSKNQNHSVKLLLNKLKATNQQKLTKCFQNCCRLMTDFARKTRHDNFQGRLHLNIYFFSMFSLTLKTKVTLHLEQPFEHSVGVYQVHKKNM